MDGVVTKNIFSDGRCVRTSFLLTDPRFAEVIPEKTQIHVGKTALGGLLPQIERNIANKHTTWQAAAVRDLVLSLLGPDPINQVSILRHRSDTPSIAVCYRTDYWLTDELLAYCLNAINWAFATLLTACADA